MYKKEIFCLVKYGNDVLDNQLNVHEALRRVKQIAKNWIWNEHSIK